MSEALHLEGGHFGIRTIVIEPGFFKTNISESHHDFGVAEPPYDELSETMAKLEADLAGTRRRVPVGTDAEMVLGARASLDDAAFEKAMREVLKLDR
ncbi:MAG TPA: hypothetical protein VMU64_03785 [Acidimicrobiales bacterium]|nr:hypothetical protein [Acidimicrobiales bacterium]